MDSRGVSTVRLPLQVGTGAITYATGMAVGAAFTVLLAVGAIASATSASPVQAIVLAVVALLMLAYAVSAARIARRTRASDLGIHEGGVLVRGGPRSGRSVGWAELRPPFASVQTAQEHRVELAWILVGFPLAFVAGLFFSSLGGRSDSGAGPVRAVTVTRLWLHMRGGEDVLLAETEDEDEAASILAAADTMSSLAEGRRVVEQASACAASIVVCAECGAAAIPSEESSSPCTHCGARVPMPDPVRRLAASARESAAARADSHRIVTTLLEQPDAVRVNRRLRVLLALQLAAWPLGWAAAAWHARAAGWSGSEIPHLLLPLIAVLGLLFVALGTVSERRALRALALGFGALAPRRPGEAARCRRCHGPLAAAAGVAACAYCGADNVVGIDLRAVVDAARAEQPTFDELLSRRRQTRVSTIGLGIVAMIFMLFWLGVTAAHAAGV